MTGTFVSPLFVGGEILLGRVDEFSPVDAFGIDRDRGTPRDATPPTPPGIRVPYRGGSTELGLGGRIDWGRPSVSK